MRQKKNYKNKKIEKVMPRKKITRFNEDLPTEINLRNQYEVIRKDLLRLRSDLQKGYNLAKIIVEKKGIWGKLLKLK